MTALNSYYQNKISHTAAELSAISRKMIYTSLARMLFFLAIIFTAYYTIKQTSFLVIILLLLSIIGFLAMVSRYLNLKAAAEYNTELKTVLQNEVITIEGGKNSFDAGAHFATGELFWDDLDVFGNGSLFHSLNRTSTQYGMRALAENLKYPLLQKDNIFKTQHAIKVYAQQMPLVESLIATALLHKTAYASFDSLFEWLDRPNILHASKWLQYVRVAFPILNILLILLALINGNIGFLGITFLLGWLLIGLYAKYLQTDFGMLGKKEAILKQYAVILSTFKTVNTQDAILLIKYQALAEQAHQAIKSLSKLSNRIDQRLNLFIITFFNPYFLYDIQNMFALEDWKTKYHHLVKEWMECVGAIEQLNSLATFAFQNEENCYPTILEDTMVLSATGLTHPLINKKNRIPNDITIGENNKLLLITGSNMSGKTTFLRTLGVNLLLAQNGLPVCAKSFSFLPLQIFTSIRISDSLQENTSYFMAELKKLKALKNGVQASSASLVLIDEILRGTNSDDKYYGSEQFVKELIKYNCLSLFATHDLKLSEMEESYPTQIANYCFESTIDNEELFFDYKIRRGVAQNKNASFLMKKMGII